MAKDIADLLTMLAIQRANVLGHDRGARVAYRFALDHPERINKLGIIEIVPTADFGPVGRLIWLLRLIIGRFWLNPLRYRSG